MVKAAQKFDLQKSLKSLKLQISKKTIPEQLVVISAIIFIYYQMNSSIVDNFTLDLILKLVVFGSILYTAFYNKKYISIILTIILGLIFVQQSQIKKGIVIQAKELPSVQKKEKTVEKYGKYELTLWDDKSGRDLSDSSLKRKMLDKEDFAPLKQQPTNQDMKQMEDNLQKALITNILNQEELENVEAKMITAEGLQRLQMNKFSDSDNVYHAPEFKKFVQKFNVPGICSTQATCHKTTILQ